MYFNELNLHAALGRAVRDMGYATPTPIQELAIPHVMQQRDVLGCAQTGTGKTAAFALPVLHQLLKGPEPGKRRPIRVLALAPTRELAIQIGDSFADYGAFTKLRHCVVYGGVSQNPQTRALQAGVDILVATPGRLLDLIGQGFVKLDRVETFILDEADRMLDMGFIHDIKRIVKIIPKKRQTLLFSATVPPAIRRLAENLLDRPEQLSATPSATTVESIEQSVFMVEKQDKVELLIRLIRHHRVERTLVFSRTKYGADKIVRKLNQASISSAAIHGNKSQNNRQRALAAFKEGQIRVLVATDIASRGLDIDAVSHVFNFDLPHESEAYVHRIGRTGRAGAAGIAFSFCSTEERQDLRAIERLIHQRLTVLNDPGPQKREEGMIMPVLTKPQPKVQPRQRGGYSGSGQGKGRSRRSNRPPQKGRNTSRRPQSSR